jgi:hypothetical protein
LLTCAKKNWRIGSNHIKDSLGEIQYYENPSTWDNGKSSCDIFSVSIPFFRDQENILKLKQASGTMEIRITHRDTKENKMANNPENNNNRQGNGSENTWSQDRRPDGLG